MSDTFSRRFFVGAASAAAATRVIGANDKINVGLVGLGGRGTNHLNIYARLPGARLAAICDVNQAAREVANASLFKITSEKAKEYPDMREVFADKNIDAVSIATPNHWHALATIWACKAGKDVYCEKPASHNIYEGQQMLKVSLETKRMVQIGSQHRSTPFKMKGIEAMQQGLIGKVYMAKGLCYKRRPSIGHKPDIATPAGINWDMFLGPAPMRAFNELRFKYNWHWFWDTGNGDIGNQGVHEMGIARWGLGDPEFPKTAISTGGKLAYEDDQETPNMQSAYFDFGNGRQLSFEVRGLLTGGEGTPQTRIVRGPGAGPATTATPAADEKPKSTPLNISVGNLFYGSEGWVAMSDAGFQAYKGESSELIMEEKPERGRGADATGLHMENFLAACRSRNAKDLHDGIANAYISAAMVHLANISYRTGEKLTLAPGPTFVNNAAANEMLTRKYRAPYVL